MKLYKLLTNKQFSNTFISTIENFTFILFYFRYYPSLFTGRNGRFTCLYEKNKDHLKNQKIFNFTIKDSYIT